MAKAVRDPKTGRFRKRTTARKTTTRKRKAPTRTAARKAPARKRTYRRNPKMPDLIGMFTQGTITAAEVLVGKALTRTVPDLAGLPKQGNVGLAVQAAVAVAAGFVADMFLSRQAAAAILAGGLTAPLETFLVSQNVPWIGEALSPTTAVAEVEALTGIGRYPGVGRYPALVAGYPAMPSTHLGRYPQAAEGGEMDYAAGVY